MTYKTGWLKKVINGVSTKIFSFAHVKTVYTDYENGKLLSDKLTEIDGDIAELNSNLDGLENDCLTLQNTPLKNGVYFGNDGVFGDSTNYKCSEFHEITPNTPIKLELNIDNDDWALLFYDENKTYLGRSNSVFATSGKLIETTTPPNAKYATIDVHLYNGNFPIPKLYTTKIGRVVSSINESLSVIGKCKNLLNPALQTTTQNGVTCTNNGDGTYTLNGTATKNVNFSFFYNLEKYQHLKNRTVKLVGCPKGGSSTTYRLMLQLQKDPWSGAYDSGEGSSITINNDDNWQCWIRIYEGATVSNLVFKPMITTDLSATYDDFVPYTGDGETLSEDVAELKNDLDRIEGISTTEQIVGTFLGKNLYRNTVVLNFSTPFTVASGNNDTCITSSTGMESQASSYEGSIPWGSIDTLVNAESFVETSSYRFTNPFIFKKDKTGYWYCRNTYGETIAATQIVLTLYYTKY